MSSDRRYDRPTERACKRWERFCTLHRAVERCFEVCARLDAYETSPLSMRVDRNAKRAADRAHRDRNQRAYAERLLKTLEARLDAELDRLTVELNAVALVNKTRQAPAIMLVEPPVEIAS